MFWEQLFVRWSYDLSRFNIIFNNHDSFLTYQLSQLLRFKHFWWKTSYLSIIICFFLFCWHHCTSHLSLFASFYFVDSITHDLICIIFLDILRTICIFMYRYISSSISKMNENFTNKNFRQKIKTNHKKLIMERHSFRRV